MARLQCPHCGADLPSKRTWDQVAVSSLIAAPAVSDMATQVRCGHCGRISAASDLRMAGADRFISQWALPALPAAVAVLLLAWLFLR